MAGETIRTEAVCLDIRPWSRTSHIVTWLTPVGKVATVVKGAVRPKSAFLGQYDLNYTCDILYYARAKGELHALRDCVPLDLRESLRGNYRALALAGYFRQLVSELAPSGPDCRPWYELLSSSLTPQTSPLELQTSNFFTPSSLVLFELRVLELAGLKPDFSSYDRQTDWSPFSIETGTFSDKEGRCVRLSREVAEWLSRPERPAKNPQIPLDAAWVIGVFYKFHLDCPFDARRAVLGMIS